MAHHESTTVLRREDCRIIDIPHAEAASFIEQHHYSRSAANTSTVRHGLEVGGELVGAILWQPPTKLCALSVVRGTRLPWQGVLSCSRLAVANGVAHNGASFLLGQSMKRIDRERWPAFVTYADTRLGHTGSIYRATNWICMGETKAGDVWLGPDGEQRGRKRGGKTLKRDEMLALGFTKAPNLPKIKFVHYADKRAQRFAQAKARGLQRRAELKVA